VIRVCVREQDGVKPLHAGAQSLLAKVGSGVNHNILAIA